MAAEDRRVGADIFREGILGALDGILHRGRGDAPFLRGFDLEGHGPGPCSLVNAVVLIAGSWAGGWLTQRFGYRVMFIWDFIITGIAMIFLYLVYLEWKRFGGRNYVAPQVK